MKSILIRLGLSALFLSALAGCGGSDGAAGPAGAAGAAGTAGTPGAAGATGATGAAGPALGITVTDMHGAAKSLEATRGANNTANPFTTITAASVNASGKLQVDFKVTTDAAGATPYTVTVPASALRFSIAALRPGDSAGDSSYWVNYVNSWKTKAAGVGTTAAGYKANQPGQETATAGTLTSTGSGTYRYVSAVTLTSGIDLSAPASAVLPNGGLYPYNAALTHRVGIQLSDPDGTGTATMGANNAIKDFVPNGGVLTTREVVDTSNCNNACHKTLALHGGGRLDTKLCVTCHNPTNVDPESGNTLDFKVMVHKIHSAKYLPSVNIDFAGDYNGQYKANPAAAIKGTPYVIWGHLNTKFDFSEALIPANPANCTVCHKNAVDADNWKNKPTKEACGSCHDGINFANAANGTAGSGTRMWFPDSKISMAGAGFPGTPVARTDVTGFAAAISLGHKGGQQSSNAACASCHVGTATSQAAPDLTPTAQAVHGDFTNSWSKMATDLSISLTMSAPANGTHYVAGEKPIATIVITELTATGAVSGVIDHTTISDAASSIFGSGTAVGNLYGLCTTTGGQVGGTCTPKGVSVNGALNLYVSGPRALKKPALTTAAARKTFFSLTGAKYTNAANDLRARTAANFPMQDDVGAVSGVPDVTKVTGVLSRATTGNLQYQLNDVAGLAPGTYVAFVQATRKSSAGVVPKAMSMALATFQVGQAAEEKRVAYGCPDCHSTTVWHDNATNGVPGNHPAAFNTDYCGSCHDYEAPQLASATGAGGVTYVYSYDSTGNEVISTVTLPGGSGQLWKTGGNNMGFGAAPIARRVHGVHAGGIKRANGTPMLNYPLEIYNGHNVSIKFPQDVKNCEKCHNATTSGTWKSKPSRVACMACHDSDAAYAHATLQTLDPTPVIATAASSVPPANGPYSGDELESCPVCHAAFP